MKKYLTNAEILDLAVGVVDYEETDGILHMYKCLREQISAYWKLSDNLGEWSARTTGVRLDFVTNSSFFEFKIIVGKKFELFVNGVREDFIESGEGSVFCKTLDNSKGENRLTLIFPNHEAGAIDEVAIENGVSYSRYKHTYGKKILFFGDSITQGWDTKYDSNCYAYQVSLRYDADTVIFGVGGAYFHGSIAPSHDDYHPDVVIVALGANDHRFGIEKLDENMHAFLDRIVPVYKNSQIIGMSPIGGVGHGDEPTDFDIRIAEIFAEYGIECISARPLVSPDADNFADRYHPNDKGYIEYADNLMPILDKMIK